MLNAQGRMLKAPGLTENCSNMRINEYHVSTKYDHKVLEWDGPRRSPSTVCESRYGTMDVQKCGIRKDQARSVILGFLKHDNSQKINTWHFPNHCLFPPPGQEIWNYQVILRETHKCIDERKYHVSSFVSTISA